jgi:predicted Zn-dependent peptidase
MLRHVVSEIKLKNGARGLLIDVPDASVMSVRINFRAGDVYGPSEKKWETAHIMEHLSLGANNGFASSREFQAVLDQNGAYSNATTAQSEMTYEGECADFEWQRFLELFIGAIAAPKFLEHEFTAEKGNVHEELVGRGNNHASRLGLEMAKRYGFKFKTWQDRVELMKHVTLQDVKDHYARTHHAENMRFVIAGRLRGRKKTIRSLLEGMPLASNAKTGRLPLLTETATKLPEIVYIANDTVPNAYFYIDTYINRELPLSDLYALGVLGTMLTDTLHSKILGEAREKGLIYYLSSDSYRTPGCSSWWFGSQISEEQLPAFLAIFIRELQSVMQGSISAADLEAAKRYQLGGYQRGAQTVNALTNGYSGLYFYNGTISDYYTDFEKHLSKIDATMLSNIACAMFGENIWGLGYLGTISEKARQASLDQLDVLWR